MLRKLILASFFTLPLFAQLQLFQFDGTTEAPVAGTWQVAPAAPNDNIETRFRVRNPGTGPVTLTKLSIAGQSFRISASPSLPYIIASGQFTEFKVMFSPTALGSYSASLQVNSLSFFVRGTAILAATVSTASGPLAAGAAVDFGRIERGTSVVQSFTLSSATPTSIGSIVITGAAFQAPAAISAPLTIGPSQSITFQITFAPQTAGPATGQLSIDQRSFTLTGLGLDPPLPTASIQLGMQTGASARQSTVSIPLAAPSKISGTGTLTMEFHPNVPGVTNDPAVQFLSGPQRMATVSIAAGDAMGKFGSSVQLPFQTGTTAGTIVFTLTLPNGTQTASLTIPPAPISFDLAAGTRRVSDLDVSLIGFDNTYSASQLAFTFYGQTGQVLAPGTLRADETSVFRTYFSSGLAGGAFQLRATFPVTGDATKVAGVDVEVTNSVGVAKTQRITF